MALSALGMVAAWPASAATLWHAKAKSSKSAAASQSTAKKPAKAAAKPKSAPSAKGKGKAAAAAPPAPLGPAKVAVFAFEGDGAAPIRKQVLRSLRAKGFKVVPSLRPVDSAEQYREMATALGLAAYLDGEVSADGDRHSATIRVRDGHSGTRIATVVFAADGRKLPSELGKTFWQKLGPALTRARAEAAKTPKGGKGPMRIDAGTPLENTPAESTPAAGGANDEHAAAPARKSAKHAPAAATDSEVAAAERELEGDGNEGTSRPAAATRTKDDDGEEASPKPRASARRSKPRDEDDENDGDGDGDGDDDAADAVATRRAQTPGAGPDVELDIDGGVRLFTRNYSYANPVGGLTPYQLSWAPAPAGAVEWYPGARAGVSALANLGVVAAGEAAVGTISRTHDGKSFATSAFSYGFGLKWRLPVGPVALAALATYGVDAFRIAGTAADGTPKPPVPDVGYRHLRLGAELHFDVAPRVTVAGAAAYRLLLPGLGELTSDAYFPHATGFGVDVAARVAVRLVRGIELRLEGDFRRYLLSAHSQAADMRMTGSIVDDQFGVQLSVAALIGGRRGF